MSYMFAYCSKLTNLDVSNWDTSNVTNMSEMFWYCSKLTTDCSSWDVSKVTNHSGFKPSSKSNIIEPNWVN